MKKISHWIFYFIFGFLTLLFFLYLSFPRALIKERIANALTKQTKSIVAIKDLSLNFPLSMTLHEVTIIQPNIKSRLTLQRVEVNLSLLSLIVGTVDTSINIKKNEESWLHLAMVSNGIPRSDKKNPLASFTLKAQNFIFSDFLNFAVRYKNLTSKSLGFSLLAETEAKGGSLNGIIALESMNKPKESSGSIDLKISDLELANPSLSNIQKFSQPITLKAKIEKEIFKFTSPLHIKSEELDFKLLGSILKPLEHPRFDLELNFSLMGDIKNMLGNLLNSYQTEKNHYSINIKGGIYNPIVSKNNLSS